MDLGSLTLLVAEDDDGTREALAELLQEHGVETAVAVDGQDALEQLAAGEAPCIILLDWVMPRVTGEAFLRARQASAALSSIPVVVLSASHVPAADADVQGYLAKPFRIGELLPLLRRVCETACPPSRRARKGCAAPGGAPAPA